MKKLFLAIALVAVAMVGCKGTGSKASSGSDSTARVPSSQIAYVNMDSLVSKYNLYLDLKTEFEAKAKKVEGELTAKGRSFERDVNDYQDKAQKGLITSRQAQEMEQNLQKKQQNVVAYRERVMQEMGEEEQVMLNRIHYSIVDFLKEFNSDFRYGMIVSTNAGGPVLNADPALDITSLVLEGLNKKYAAEKGKATKGAKETEETATEETK